MSEIGCIEILPTELLSMVAEYLEIWAVGKLFCSGSKILCSRLSTPFSIRSMRLFNPSMLVFTKYPALFRHMRVLKQVILVPSKEADSTLVIQRILEWLPETVEILSLPINAAQLITQSSDTMAVEVICLNSRFPALKELYLEKRRSLLDQDTLMNRFNRIIEHLPSMLQSLSLNCENLGSNRSHLRHLPSSLQTLSLQTSGSFYIPDIAHLTSLESLSLLTANRLRFEDSMAPFPLLCSLNIPLVRIISDMGGIQSQKTILSFFELLPPSLSSLDAAMFLVRWSEMPWWHSLRTWIRRKSQDIAFSNFTEIPPNLTYLDTERIHVPILGDLIQSLPNSLRYLRLQAECGSEITKQFPTDFLTHVALPLSNLQAIDNLPSSVTHLFCDREQRDPRELLKLEKKLMWKKIARFTLYRSSLHFDPFLPYESTTYYAISGLNEILVPEEVKKSKFFISPKYLASMDLISLIKDLIANEYYEEWDFQKWEVMAEAVRHGAHSYLKWLLLTCHHIIPSLIREDGERPWRERVYEVALENGQEEVAKWLKDHKFVSKAPNDEDEDEIFPFLTIKG